jgi:transcriptional regulator with XRE-family HTH domain
MSLRELAKRLNLGGHGTLVDYEHGRRIPPADIVEGCERIFEISDGALRNLREKALAERADQHTEQLLRAGPEQAGKPEEPAPVAGAPPRRKRRRTRALLVAGAITTAVVLGLGIGLWQAWTSTSESATTASSAPPTSMRIDFSKSSQTWGVFWGSQVAKIQFTTVTAYRAGGRSLQITVTGATDLRGPAGIATVHDLNGLRPGMKVTFYLRVAGPPSGSGVRFWVYNSKSDPTFAPETFGDGDNKPLPSQEATWTPYAWTVPQVDTVHAIGMQIYSATNDPLIVWLGAVNW